MPSARFLSRPFRDDADFWRIRSLVIETYALCGPGWNWDLRRWDSARFYNPGAALDPAWKDTLRLWESPDGRLAGAANQDSPGLFFLQIHPDQRAVEEEMVAWAEQALAVELPGTGRRRVETEVFEYDTPRQRILTRRGFARQPGEGSIRKLRIGGQALPEVEMAPGYTLRPIRGGDPADCQRLADLLNAAFNRSFHNEAEFIAFARCAPSYREDLHLVAEAPDGSFGAHVAAIYDEANRRGLYEPVCTHPAHRRLGLAQALMAENLRRLKALGAREVTVETGDALPANAFYDAFGFSELYRGHTWRKEF